MRTRRSAGGLTLRTLAARARVSERFLLQLESGEGNISVARLQEIAEALGTTASHLLSSAQPSPAAQASPARRVLALLGVRGAGKSAIGQLVARRLRVPFVELDALVALEAGMSLSTIFEMHGEAYYRRLERQTLKKLLELPSAMTSDPKRPAAVVATGGSLVTDAETYALLRQRAVTVWLKASAADHWARVVAQGDVRPMKDRENAMSELRSLLRSRKPLYAQAEHVVDTSSLSLEEAAARVLLVASEPGNERVSA